MDVMRKISSVISSVVREASRIYIGNEDEGREGVKVRDRGQRLRDRKRDRTIEILRKRERMIFERISGGG